MLTSKKQRRRVKEFEAKHGIVIKPAVRYMLNDKRSLKRKQKGNEIRPRNMFKTEQTGKWIAQTAKGRFLGIFNSRLQAIVFVEDNLI